MCHRFSPWHVHGFVISRRDWPFCRWCVARRAWDKKKPQHRHKQMPRTQICLSFRKTKKVSTRQQQLNKTKLFFDVGPAQHVTVVFFFVATSGRLTWLTWLNDFDTGTCKRIMVSQPFDWTLATGEIHLYGNHLRNQGLDGQQLELVGERPRWIPSDHLILHDCTRPQKIWVNAPYVYLRYA